MFPGKKKSLEKPLNDIGIYVNSRNANIVYLWIKKWQDIHVHTLLATVKK